MESDGSVGFIDSDGAWLGGAAVPPHGTSILGATGQVIRNTSPTSATRNTIGGIAHGSSKMRINGWTIGMIAGAVLLLAGFVSGMNQQATKAA